MQVVHLEERDGFMDEFVNVVIATDPFMDPYESEGGAIRTVFAWGHPVLKITGPGAVFSKHGDHDAQRPASWQWLGLDDAIEPADLTRQREAVANFLVNLGMVGQDYEDDYESLAGALGTDGETGAFNEFIENLGEHDLPVWVDSVVARVPYDEEQDG